MATYCISEEIGLCTKLNVIVICDSQLSVVI